jgi:hypothetical protein
VALLRARRPVVRAGGALLVVAFLAIGSWTVADRGAYLVSIWPRLRTELVSLDEAVRRIDPAAAIVLYQPRAAGYSATVATWHGIAWLMLIRGPGMPNPAFALWSPDRDANCVADAADLRCTGDMQPPSRFPIERLVVLRYDPVDCRIKLVEGAAAGARLPALPAAYDPGKWIREPPAPVSPLVGKVLHGPQGLGRDVGCNPAAAF